MFTLIDPSLRTLALLVVASIVLIYISQRARKVERAILSTLWVVYMLIMLAMTLPPATGTREGLSFAEILIYHRPWNLQPFSLIPRQFQNMLAGQAGAAKQFLGNIILFIPAGFFPPMLFKPMRRWYGAIVPGFLWSLFIEVTQLVLNLSGLGDRSFDTDDLILNTLGALIGYIVYKAIFAYEHRPSKTGRKKSVKK